MADSLQTLQARRDALQAAIDSGVLSVTDNGRTVTYRNQTDMLKALSALDGRIGATASTTPVRRTYGGFIGGNGL